MGISNTFDDNSNVNMPYSNTLHINTTFSLLLKVMIEESGVVPVCGAVPDMVYVLC